MFISTNDNLFGKYPYVCIKQGKKYFEVNLMISGLNKWISSPILLNGKFDVFVVANNNSGNSLVQQKKLNVQQKAGKMKFLIVGLGSIGKRHIRNLLKLKIQKKTFSDLIQEKIELMKQENWPNKFCE